MKICVASAYPYRGCGDVGASKRDQDFHLHKQLAKNMVILFSHADIKQVCCISSFIFWL